MERIYIRVDKVQKKLLESLAKDSNSSLNEYVKYKLFEQNTAIIDQEYVFHCPSGERYNYAIAGISMLNYLLLEALLEKSHGEKSESIKNHSIEKSRKILEDLYGYKKTRVRQDE